MDWIWKIMTWAIVVLVLFQVSMMANAQCDYLQEMQLEQDYFIYNTEYPNYYTAGTSCRWTAHAPAGSRIYLRCEEINIPVSENCNADVFAVSLTGNEELNDARRYCGNGNLTLVSDLNALTVGLYASYYSTGGRIMCTISATLDSGSTTEKPSNCDCGWRFLKRIVGGAEAGINEFPYMAALYHITKREIHCGASIISDRYVLTAGHCFTIDTLSDLCLLVGDHDITTGEDTGSAELYLLESYKVNEYYNPEKKQNDIAIVKTNRQIIFTDRVGPVCLPFKFLNYDFTHSVVTLLGWGSFEFSAPSSNTLQKVDVEVQSLDDCRRNLTSGDILDTAMCTYAPGKDACQFDSGGPALYEDYNNRRLYLTGIISYGRSCAASVFAVNTRVTSFLLWILQNTGDAQYCNK